MVIHQGAILISYCGQLYIKDRGRICLRHTRDLEEMKKYDAYNKLIEGIIEKKTDSHSAADEILKKWYHENIYKKTCI